MNINENRFSARETFQIQSFELLINVVLRLLYFDCCKIGTISKCRSAFLQSFLLPYFLPTCITHSPSTTNLPIISSVSLRGTLFDWLIITLFLSPSGTTHVSRTSVYARFVCEGNKASPKNEKAF